MFQPNKQYVTFTGKVCAEWLALVAFCCYPLTGLAAEDGSLELLLQDPGLCWTAPLAAPAGATPLVIADSQVEPAQMLAPQRQPGMQVAQRQPPSNNDSSRDSGLSSVPFMIGDTGAGSCASFSGFLIDAELAHPTMACGRLNIAENNTPLPTDRFYVSYRHFENATPVRIFQFERDYNIDRYTLGGEHTFNDGLWSIEMRLPLENRMSSDFATVNRSLGDGTFDVFRGGTRTELGNISMITKALLVEDNTHADFCGPGSHAPNGPGFCLHCGNRRLHYFSWIS